MLLKKGEKRVEKFPVATSVPGEVVDQIEELCEAYNLNRAEVLRQILIPGIENEVKEMKKWR